VEGNDAEPLQQQVLEVPPITSQVTEYQLRRLCCARCDVTTC